MPDTATTHPAPRTFSGTRVLAAFLLLIGVCGAALYYLAATLQKPPLDQAKVDILLLGSAVEDYLRAHGHPPESLQQLVDDGLVNVDPLPTDPWGGAYRYSCSGPTWVIASNGPDRQPNTADDITSSTLRRERAAGS